MNGHSIFIRTNKKLATLKKSVAFGRGKWYRISIALYKNENSGYVMKINQR